MRRAHLRGRRVPGEHRNALRRIIVTQADTEPASVEQQRMLAHTAPSLYDMRNLFQVNVEEGRHLWAMVYLLHKHFGRDGRDEAEELLERHSGDPDKPRILGAFNQPCDNWLSFFAFTMFTDRDGKFQLAALRESAFDPLARSCEFMLTEEAFHLFVGETGLERIILRSAELAQQDPNGDPRALGGIDFPMIQRAINYWFTYCLDLFGGEISTNAAQYFATGLKGRFKEAERYEDHVVSEGAYELPVVENGQLHTREVPMRNAMNEVLRDDYIQDCERAVRRWNRRLEAIDSPFRVTLPNRRFHRHQGIYAGHDFDPEGKPDLCGGVRQTPRYVADVGRRQCLSRDHYETCARAREVRQLDPTPGPWAPRSTHRLLLRADGVNLAHLGVSRVTRSSRRAVE